MKMSPFGATRTMRGSRRLEANSSTWKPGGTLGAAETGFGTTRGGFDADRVAYGEGRSVILRRTKGASVRQSPNAALPTNSSPRESEAGWAETAGAKKSTQGARNAGAAAAMIPRGMLGALRRLQREQEPGRYVFMSERGAPMSAVAFRRMLTRLGPAAKMRFEMSVPPLMIYLRLGTRPPWRRRVASGYVAAARV